MSMKINDPIPQFSGATKWLNGTELQADEVSNGSPTLVHFWAVSCGICKTNMPALRDLRSKFGAKGLKTIAVHMPRYEADTDVNGVEAAITEFEINELCAIDNEHKLKDAFQNEQGWVPVYYLFDGDRKLRSRSAGEYGLGVLTKALEKMFGVEAATA